MWVGLSSFVSADLAVIWSIQDDLQTLNVSCEYDSCLEGRTRDNLISSACQCGPICVQLGTCCIDSQYIDTKPSQFRPTCRSLGKDKSFYIMDRCPTDSAWKNLCEEEWYDGVMRIVPVTSLFTLRTYKNYFCMRCHEDTEEFLYWNLRLESSDEFDETIAGNKTVSPSYDRYHRTWVAPLGYGGSLVAVTLGIEIPPEVLHLPVSCDTELISGCSHIWSDEGVRKKCEAYMGQVHIRRGSYIARYKNIHCAKCSFENLTKIECKEPIFSGFGVKVPFSFTYLLDINQSDGDKVGKIKKCENDYLWDPYSKLCRKLTCALPGRVVINGKCVKP